MAVGMTMALHDLISIAVFMVDGVHTECICWNTTVALPIRHFTSVSVVILEAVAIF